MPDVNIILVSSEATAVLKLESQRNTAVTEGRAMRKTRKQKSTYVYQKWLENHIFDYFFSTPKSLKSLG